jgi:hypothetical protein
MWDLWWTKWHWGRFSPSTSVSPANSHSTGYSTCMGHLSSEVGTIGHLVVDVQSRLNLTPPQEINKKAPYLPTYLPNCLTRTIERTLQMRSQVYHLTVASWYLPGGADDNHENSKTVRDQNRGIRNTKEFSLLEYNVV